MPDYAASSETPSGLTGKQVRELYEELRGAFSARNGLFTERGELYRGKHWDGVNLIAHRDRYSLTANYIAKTVDKSVEALVGMMPAIQVLPQSEEQDSRDQAEKAEAVLYGTWAANRMDILLRKVAWNVALKREGHLYMWWDQGVKQVRYRSVAPENFYPVWDGDDLVECIVVSARLSRELQRSYPKLASKIKPDGESDDVMVSTFDGGARGSDFSYSVTTEDGQASGNATGLSNTTKVIDWFDRHGNWVRIMGDAVHTQKLGYDIGRPPVYSFYNTILGDSDESRGEIEDVIELNRYYDQLLSQQADIIKKYSNPPILDDNSGQSAIDIQRAVRADGGVIPLKANGDIRYLNWDGTMPEIGAQLERVKDLMHDLSGKPRSAYGETVTNQSGVVTNLALTPTVAQTTSRETLMGATLKQLNADTLCLYEKFMPSDDIKFHGKRAGRTPYQSKAFEVTMKGREIDGWYENAIKWPSAYRVDDPVYVQNKISLMTMEPTGLSLYDGLEELGYDDVEGRIDRIKAQREDPRLHPEVTESAVNSAVGLAGATLPTGGIAGVAGDLSGGYDATEGMNEAAEAMGSPDRSALVDGI